MTSRQGNRRGRARRSCRWWPVRSGRRVRRRTGGELGESLGQVESAREELDGALTLGTVGVSGVVHGPGDGVEGGTVGGARRLPVAHGDTHLDRFAELLLEQLALSLAVVHERGAGAAGLLTGVPDGGVRRRRCARAHPQDDAFQDGSPPERVRLDDPAVGEELPQEGPNGSGRGWRPGCRGFPG